MGRVCVGRKTFFFEFDAGLVGEVASGGENNEGFFGFFSDVGEIVDHGFVDGGRVEEHEHKHHVGVGVL